MNRLLAQETLQNQIKILHTELKNISLSPHLLQGPKKWRITENKTEMRKKELSRTVEEYQRILSYTSQAN